MKKTTHIVTLAHLDVQIEKLLALPSGWLIYNTHGLDEEGWGPIRARYLDDLLARLTALESVAVLPAWKALRPVWGGHPARISVSTTTPSYGTLRHHGCGY